MDIGRPPPSHHIRTNLWMVGGLASFTFRLLASGSTDVVWADWRVLWVDTEHVQEFRRSHWQCPRGRHSADSRYGRAGRVRGRSGQRAGSVLGDECLWHAGGPSQLGHSILCGIHGCVDSIFVRGGASGASGASCGGGSRSIWSGGSDWNVCQSKSDCGSWISACDAPCESRNVE